jgi:uncharacterized secreted protein with C-terminal beta-propeller domain
MNKDREYIKELFDNDGINVPDSLSEENMLAMLEKAEEKRSESKRSVRRPSLRMVMGLAAAMLVAVFGISGLMDIVQRPPDTSLVGGELYTFGSEKEIEKLLSSINKGDNDGLRQKVFAPNDTAPDTGLIEYEEAPGEAVSSDSAATGLQTSSAAGSAADHSGTYLQVEGIDEADIVKTDGSYIYFVNNSKEVVIYSAEDGKTEKLSTIGYSGVENYIDDIYLSGDRLITVGNYYKDGSQDPCTGIVVYDISDRNDPKELYDFSQSGSILSSRMTGGYVYLVTNDYVYRGGRTVPLRGSIDTLSSLKAGDICCVPEPQTSSYIVLSAIDVSSGTQGKAVTKAILGAGENIYCNDHNLYSVSGEWNSKDNVYSTRIVRASLDGLKVKFNATAKVRGYALSQFAMDEKDGYFRIATTSERGGIDVNNLFVLDPDLKEAGSVTGFARNESIKAVRYVGDKAYVITYEAIDPLFIIDLSDPEDPSIEGEVMIDGFSTLLVPVNEGRMLGIGHATGDNGYGGEYDSGLKLALFDISDPSHPAVLDSMEFKDMMSPAQSDHHALMVNAEAGYYAIPYSIDRYGDIVIDGGGALIEDEDVLADKEPAVDSSHEAGVLVFGAEDSIRLIEQHALDQNWLVRNVYIGDWIYALDSEGNISSFRPEIQ